MLTKEREMQRIVMTLALLLFATIAVATDYNYVKSDTFKTWIESGKDLVIVDIQTPEEFSKHHFKGAVETNAYPVKNDEERARLDQALTRIGSTNADVVIICPRGGGGAKNTYDYLKSQGVAEARLFILEKGIEGWPYSEMCVTGR